MSWVGLVRWLRSKNSFPSSYGEASRRWASSICSSARFTASLFVTLLDAQYSASLCSTREGRRTEIGMAAQPDVLQLDAYCNTTLGAEPGSDLKFRGLTCLAGAGAAAPWRRRGSPSAGWFFPLACAHGPHRPLGPGCGPAALARRGALLHAWRARIFLLFAACRLAQRPPRWAGGRERRSLRRQEAFLRHGRMDPNRRVLEGGLGCELLAAGNRNRDRWSHLQDQCMRSGARAHLAARKKCAFRTQSVT